MKVHVVDLKSESIASPISVRAYLNQMITEFKQLIAQVSPSSLFFYCNVLSPSSTVSFVYIIHGNVLQTINLTYVVCFFPGDRPVGRNHACGPGALL